MQTQEESVDTPTRGLICDVDTGESVGMPTRGLICDVGTGRECGHAYWRPDL